MIGLTLILAGAIGNFIDRVRLGYVIDMFQTDFMNFPIFNVAHFSSDRCDLRIDLYYFR